MGYKELRDRLRGLPVDDEEEMVNKYRLVFNTPLGRRVLTHILTELHFFDGILANPEEIALRNYGIVLLNRAGVWNAENVEEIVSSLMNISPKRKEDQE
jgi:hypothetical protein